MQDTWLAKWIGYRYDPREDLGVFEFRRVFESRTGGPVSIRVSADQRYKLYLNGKLVGFGPQRGDLEHWFYETYDLDTVVGENELVAVVWNFGYWAPMAQVSARTAFVCEDLDSGRLSTPGEWEVRRFAGWEFAMMHNGIGEYYIDVGPGEVRDFRAEPQEWQRPNVIAGAERRGATGGGTPWMLIPRTIPAMRYEDSGIEPIDRTIDWRADAPPGTFLLDFGQLLCAYPVLEASSPEGSHVRLTFAEALWQGHSHKGNRNDLKDKVFHGYQDRVFLTEDRNEFEPLWWRTFRFVLVEAVDAEGKPLESFTSSSFKLRAIETGYPIREESSFEADDPSVRPIWDVSVRTVERCAGETYFDCPYYEQLQYVGDTRVQALIGYYLGRDRALQRNAVETLGWSVMENGLTWSRYPSRQAQVIPPFSLWWVMMLWDQMLYDTHRSYEHGIAAQLMGNVIEGFNHNAAEDGFWNFCDWVPSWKWGQPNAGALATMHQILASMARFAKMDRMSRGAISLIDELMGDSDPLHESLARYGARRVESYDRVNGLVRHDADFDWEATEHAEALFRVYQMMAGQTPEPWPDQALEQANAAQCTYYFSYYKHLAMCGAENPPDYMSLLQPWREQIENGLTTFAENPEPTRSDCHAWSAHPILGFFQIVAGVTSTAPSWTRARIRPNPGSLRRFVAKIAHPIDEFTVAYENGRFDIVSPIPFTFELKSRVAEYEAGSYRIEG